MLFRSPLVREDRRGGDDEADDAREPGAQPVVHSSHLDFDLDGRTIVLVDDEQNILKSLRAALEAEGYKVRTYPDGMAALEALNEPGDEIGFRLHTGETTGPRRFFQDFL